MLQLRPGTTKINKILKRKERDSVSHYPPPPPVEKATKTATIHSGPADKPLPLGPAGPTPVDQKQPVIWEYMPRDLDQGS